MAHHLGKKLHQYFETYITYNITNEYNKLKVSDHKKQWTTYTIYYALWHTICIIIRLVDEDTRTF